MLLQACRNILRASPKNQHFLSLSLAYKVATNKKLNTEVFSQLSYNQLANPVLTKALIIKPIHNHSRVSQRSLFHRKRVSGKILSCFSEKKHKVFRRVHKIKRQFYSDILGQNIFITVSSKAFRTIAKMGSFDNYILCTKPINLDSKYGEYLRELMLRKINDKNFRVPYIVGTNRKMRVKNYRKYEYINSVDKIIIPKEVKQSLRTFQKKFGKTPDQLNNEDYKKYTQLQTLKRTMGDQLQPTHPLLLQLKQKMSLDRLTPEDEQKLDKMSAEAEEAYINDPKLGEENRKKLEKTKHKIEVLEMKLQEMKFKIAREELV